MGSVAVRLSYPIACFDGSCRIPHPASPIPKRHGFSGRPDPAGSRWAEKRPETAGDDAYGAGRAVLERLQEPAMRAEARRLLGAVPRRFADDSAAGQEECFRASNLRIRDVVLNAHLQDGTPGTCLRLVAMGLHYLLQHQDTTLPPQECHARGRL